MNQDHKEWAEHIVLCANPKLRRLAHIGDAILEVAARELMDGVFGDWDAAYFSWCSRGMVSNRNLETTLVHKCNGSHHSGTLVEAKIGLCYQKNGLCAAVELAKCTVRKTDKWKELMAWRDSCEVKGDEPTLRAGVKPVG